MRYFIWERYLLIITVCSFVQYGLQLDCLQCTGPIKLINHVGDYSCLNGTLTPIPCPKSSKFSGVDYKQCTSSVFVMTPQQNGGLFIHRGCTRASVTHRDCDPPIQKIDTTISFYCTRTCTDNGCNRHSIEEILPIFNTQSKIVPWSYLSMILSLILIQQHHTE